jgi:hypothetical protein
MMGVLWASGEYFLRRILNGRLRGDMARHEVEASLVAELAAGGSCREHEPLGVSFDINQELLVSF